MSDKMNSILKYKRLHKMNMAKKQSLKIIIMYFIMGCLWIIGTDLMSNILILSEHSGIVAIDIAKGILYVSVTSVLIYKYIYSMLAKQKISERKLFESQRIFKTVFEQAPIGIAVVNNYYFMSDMNLEFEKILNRTKEELASLSWIEITHPDDIKQDIELFRQFKEGEIEGYSLEKRFIKPNGSYVWTYMVIANIHISSNNSKSKNHLCIIQDINERKIAEQSLRESERSKSVLLSNLPGIAYRSKCKNGETFTEFLSQGCYELTGYRPEIFINNKEFSSIDIIVPKYREKILNEWNNSVEKKTPYRHEYEIVNADGEQKWVMEIGRGIYDNNGNAEALEGIIIDITESKKRLEQIEYMNIHDHLTGLYNRKYFEEKKLRIDFYNYLPISIIMADINGVRLINDAFGNTEGDNLIIETANILKSCCRAGDTLARTGGDEFSIILPNTTFETANEMRKKIKEECEKYNKKISNREHYINISIGFATKNSMSENIDHTEKEANEYLLKQKIFERKSHHYAVLSSIMSTMYARSHETEEHALRIAKICKMIGEKLCFNQQQLDELYLYSMVHDIGKVGIDDRILNKQSKLTEREWNIMKTHPEIGHRIALSVPELASIAEYILYHHERWDGTGYPYGISKKEVPLMSRILAIADAYDAMTEDRVYRKAVSSEQALEEIRKNAGLQFDPDIAKIFLEIMKKYAIFV